MEQLTKRILAIVIIAVIGTGIGVGAWFFLATPLGAPQYETPGVTGVPADRMIKIGVLGDTKRTTGDGAWKGAWLAAYEINTAGGIDVGGETYYIALISEDTDEENPFLDVTKGVAAAQKIINRFKRYFSFILNSILTLYIVANLFRLAKIISSWPLSR